MAQELPAIGIVLTAGGFTMIMIVITVFLIEKLRKEI